MKAAIVAVGSELLGTDRLDTNSLRLTAVLSLHGVELVRKCVLGDAVGEIAGELSALLARVDRADRVDLVLVTGGLGPTSDDVTREAAAAALGRGMALDPAVLAGIEARFARFGRTMPAVNRRQAEVIEGATVLPNERGTAPGMRLESAAGSTLFLFPGVPKELDFLVDTQLVPWLAARSGGIGRETAVVKIAGLPESVVEERIAPAYEEFGREAITILAHAGEIRLQVTAAGPEGERQARLSEMTDRLAALVGEAVFARRAEDTLESVVGGLLRAARVTVATAESCTGGLVAERLTRVSGSSDYFPGGAVTYGNTMKQALLGVSPDLLVRHGAVSEEVARAMAKGARWVFETDYAVAITGVAGPTGGSAEKPVGTVHLAVAGPGASAEEIVHRKVMLPGDREQIRWQSSQLVLEMLRRRLLDVAEGATRVG